MSAKKTALSDRELEKQLGEALKASFPASDPLSVGQPTSVEPDRPVHRRAPELDKALVNDLAREAARKRKKKI